MFLQSLGPRTRAVTVQQIPHLLTLSRPLMAQLGHTAKLVLVLFYQAVWEITIVPNIVKSTQSVPALWLLLPNNIWMMITVHTELTCSTVWINSLIYFCSGDIVRSQVLYFLLSKIPSHLFLANMSAPNWTPIFVFRMSHPHHYLFATNIPSCLLLITGWVIWFRLYRVRFIFPVCLPRSLDRAVHSNLQSYLQILMRNSTVILFYFSLRHSFRTNLPLNCVPSSQWRHEAHCVKVHLIMSQGIGSIFPPNRKVFSSPYSNKHVPSQSLTIVLHSTV